MPWLWPQGRKLSLQNSISCLGRWKQTSSVGLPWCQRAIQLFGYSGLRICAFDRHNRATADADEGAGVAAAAVALRTLRREIMAKLGLARPLHPRRTRRQPPRSPHPPRHRHSRRLRIPRTPPRPSSPPKPHLAAKERGRTITPPGLPSPNRVRPFTNDAAFAEPAWNKWPTKTRHFKVGWDMELLRKSKDWKPAPRILAISSSSERTSER
jgi:hypothetical protein